MELIFENAQGLQLNLWHNDLFYLVDQAGQTSANADISAVTVGTLDGDIVTNVRTVPRTIVLTIRINPSVNVEYAKREILKIFKIKQRGKLIWTQNDRTVQISGYIESIDMPRWNNAVTMQISMHCSVPYWEDVEATEQIIDDSIGLHYFTAEDDYSSDMLYFPADGIPLSVYDDTRTRTFYNDGDVAVGMIIEILAIGNVTNPIIYDTFGNFFGVGYGNKQVDLVAGDTITISTVRGNLSVVKNGTTNLFNYVVPRSTWLQLQTGENALRIDSADENTDNMSFTVSYTQRYI